MFLIISSRNTQTTLDKKTIIKAKSMYIHRIFIDNINRPDVLLTLEVMDIKNSKSSHTYLMKYENGYYQPSVQSEINRFYKINKVSIRDTNDEINNYTLIIKLLE